MPTLLLRFIWRHNMNKEELSLAIEELEHIDRYMSKNWMDKDFPTDNIWNIIGTIRQEYGLYDS